MQILIETALRAKRFADLPPMTLLDRVKNVYGHFCKIELLIQTAAIQYLFKFRNSKQFMVYMYIWVIFHIHSKNKILTVEQFRSL